MILVLALAAPAAARSTPRRAWDAIRELVSRKRAPTSELSITGPRQLPPGASWAAAGVLPTRVAARQRWARGAARRIRAFYRARGYTLARVWYTVDAEGRVQLDVDEGLIKLSFVGTDDFSSFLYGVDLLPPGDIFHKPTLKRSMAELKRKRNLSAVYYRVVDTSPPVKNRLGQLVPQRQLRVYVLSKEFFGLKPRIQVSSSWGITPKLGLKYKGVFLEGDRFTADAEMAVPYRRFLFDQEPEAQWVHGQLDLGYRFPGLWGGRIAPQVDGGTGVSRYVRSDQHIEEYLTHHGEAFANAVLELPSQLTLKAGLGMAYSRAFNLELAQGSASGPADKDRYLFVTRLEATKRFDREVLRRDLRDEIGLLFRAGTSGGGDDTLLDLRFRWRFVIHLGRHDLLLRGRGVFMTGALRFWDEAELAGRYMRCFHDSRYWVREALQAGIDLRFALTRWFKLGLYHDLSAFFDRTQPTAPLVTANGFGPSLHFLMFDFFAFDIYYAFGFAPAGFDHNILFSLERAF